MSKHTNPVQKVWTFIENRKVLKLFRFSYKIAKTANSKTAITSNNTWIWRLKFGQRVQNESYSILFTHFFDFNRKWFHMYRDNIYVSIPFKKYIVNVNHQHIGISDHKAVLLTFNSDIKSQANWTFNNNLLTCKKYISKMKSLLMEWIEMKTNFDNIGIWWDFLKKTN